MLFADADAFRSIGLDRREALWEVSTKDRPKEMFANTFSYKSDDLSLIELDFVLS
jgi:error-prone DNA polymerase